MSKGKILILFSTILYILFYQILLVNLKIVKFKRSLGHLLLVE